jgi:hypothetical protein
MQIQTNNPIDALGAIKAQIADLEAQEAILREAVLALGDGKHEGELFRVTVTTVDRATLDMSAVRAKLSPQFITAHTIVKQVTSVKVAAR